MRTHEFWSVFVEWKRS